MIYLEGTSQEEKKKRDKRNLFTLSRSPRVLSRNLIPLLPSFFLALLST